MDSAVYFLILLWLINVSFVSECLCDPAGTEGVCDSVTGECTCKDTTTGAKCDQCKDGYFGFPDCKGKSQIWISKLLLNFIIQIVNATYKVL